MKKTTIIIIQTIVIVLALVYAFVKNVEAEKNFEEAARQHSRAIENEERARMAETEAVKQQALAAMQARATSQAMEEMTKCCKAKK